MDGPYSSYSALVIQTGWNTPSEARILPPSQVEEYFSGRILIFDFYPNRDV